MKKFKLQKGFIAGALGATMILTGCKNTDNKIVDSTFDNTIETTVDNTIETTIQTTVDTTISSVDSVETNNNSNLLEGIDENMPLTVEIEKVELEDFEIGYKLPNDYIPYNVDSDYQLPGIFPIEEMTDDYTVFGLPNQIDKDGNPVDVSFEGAIGVYQPYFKFLMSKNDILNKYGKLSSIDTLEDYSFATEEEQEILNAIDYLHSIVVEEYNATKGVSLKK